MEQRQKAIDQRNAIKEMRRKAKASPWSNVMVRYLYWSGSVWSEEGRREEGGGRREGASDMCNRCSPELVTIHTRAHVFRRRLKRRREKIRC